MSLNLGTAIVLFDDWAALNPGATWSEVIDKISDLSNQGSTPAQC